MTTPAETRRRAQARRSAGWWIVAAGAFVVMTSVVVAILDVQLIGVGSTMFAACGAVLFPIQQVGLAAEACSRALGDQALVAGGILALGLAALVLGVVILARTPRYL